MNENHLEKSWEFEKYILLPGKTCLGSFEYCHKRREDLCIRSVKNLLALQAQPEPVACSKTPNVNYGPSFFSYMERLLGLAPRKGRWRFFFLLSLLLQKTHFSELSFCASLLLFLLAWKRSRKNHQTMNGLCFFFTCLYISYSSYFFGRQ